ncbi:hypothetical protein GCM10027020_33010 [Nocardioides salsibiostraticola]
MPHLPMPTTVLRIAAIASLGGGAIHLAVTPDHYATWWVTGVFFLALAVFQLAWGAVVLARPAAALAGGFWGRSLWLSAAIVSAGSIILWVLTRSVIGEPFGPNAGTALPIGPAGIISSVLEAGVLLGLLVARRVRPEKTLMAGIPLLVASTLVLGGASAYGVTAGLSHDHGDHADTHLDEGNHDDGHDDGHDPAPEDLIDGEVPSSPKNPKAPGKSEPPKPTENSDDAHEDDGHGH